MNSCSRLSNSRRYRESCTTATKLLGYESPRPVCRLCFRRAETCSFVFERHLSVAYVEDAKPEGAEVTKVREVSYQLVDLRPKAVLTVANWQAGSTQATKPCSTRATKLVIAYCCTHRATETWLV